jgi:3-isopropylmalate dehydratase small subunit
MATEMGAIIILFPPSDEIIKYCEAKSGRKSIPVYSDIDAHFDKSFSIDVSKFKRMVSRPGKPHDTVPAENVEGTKIDSVFLGSCTNGRLSDMVRTAEILKGRQVAPGVVLKIVPATDEIWTQCLNDGILDIFKASGALVSNAGCAGCAAGQVGQNGPGEITISTGNRNFSGKQGKGSVYLASPDIAASSAVAGYITTPERIPASPRLFIACEKEKNMESHPVKVIQRTERSHVAEGRARLIPVDNIDTDMIFHNRYLAITNIAEMGQYTLDNLKGFESFAKSTKPGDIIITGKNFGCGSSRQQAVDCFISLGISAVIAESFGAIFERNAINAALPVLVAENLVKSGINEGDLIRVDFQNGIMTNLNTGAEFRAERFSDIQYEIFMNGGLL